MSSNILTMGRKVVVQAGVDVQKLNTSKVFGISLV